MARPDPSPSAALQDPKAIVKLRNREFQRKSRSQKKAYIEEIEQKLERCRQEGINASVEIQHAARRMKRENLRLRELLRRIGVGDTVVEEWANGHAMDLTEPSGPAPSLDRTRSAAPNNQPEEQQNLEKSGDLSVGTGSAQVGTDTLTELDVSLAGAKVVISEGLTLGEQPSDQISRLSNLLPSSVPLTPVEATRMNVTRSPSAAQSSTGHPKTVPTTDIQPSNPPICPLPIQSCSSEMCSPAEDCGASTPCKTAYEMLVQQNFRQLETGDIARRLWSGIRTACDQDEGCRVDNRVLFEVLQQISG